MERTEIMFGQWRFIELIFKAAAAQPDIGGDPHQVALPGFVIHVRAENDPRDRGERQ